MKTKGLILLTFWLLAALLLASCGDDDDDNDVDDDQVDDDAIDDDAVDDDQVDDDIVDDDAIDDDLVDDDVVDDDIVDDDIVDDDVIDDDTADDDVVMVEGCIEGDFEPYWGVLHSHTSYSDGDGLPADAFEHARDAAGLDIMVVTDHLEQLYFPLPKDRYGKCLEQAEDFYDPGTYLTDCGFEYGSGFILPWFQSTGHNNVFFSDELFPMIQLDFHNFYDSLTEHPLTVGQYNHPGSDPQQHWNNFEYFPDVDVQMNLFEYNGGGPVWEMFFEALDAGWHLSPMYNQDNHSPDWGTKNDRRSGFFLSELDRNSLYEAMMARRSFMSYDKNASLLLMADTTCWMGSILTGYDSIELDLEAFDADAGDGFTAIDIYGPGIALLATTDCEDAELCTDTFYAEITEPTYFVAKAIQLDGDWLVSAPIWVAP